MPKQLNSLVIPTVAKFCKLYHARRAEGRMPWDEGRVLMTRRTSGESMDEKLLRER